MKNSILPASIIALAGAVVGSFAMMLYASTHFVAVTGPVHEPSGGQRGIDFRRERSGKNHQRR